MEKKYAICLDVLKRLQDAGVLEDIVLVGSWCLHFYKDYFSDMAYTPSIRTRDVDFLVPTPVRIKGRIDVAGLLKDEGFVVSFTGEGYTRLLHPEIIVEFLVPERGKGTDKPYPIPQIGMNAQPLRFLDFLARNTITVTMEDLCLRIPHPAAFSLHKLIVSRRRKTEKKRLKDEREGIYVLKALIKRDAFFEVRSMLENMPSSWTKQVLKVLKETGSEDILRMLASS